MREFGLRGQRYFDEEKRKTADRPADREASGHRAAVVARGAPGRGLGLVQLGALGLFFSPARGPHAKTNGDVRGGIQQAATRSRHPQSIKEKSAKALPHGN